MKRKDGKKALKQHTDNYFDHNSLLHLRTPRIRLAALARLAVQLAAQLAAPLALPLAEQLAVQPPLHSPPLHSWLRGAWSQDVYR